MGSIHAAICKEGIAINSKLANYVNAQTAWWNPDASLTFHEKNVLLNQQNLNVHSKVHLEHSSIFSHPSNLKIVSDARIDNRSDLIKEMHLEEHISNSQLILELFLKFAFDTPAKLIGAFSFIIWDPVKKILFCARDQMGIKPLNYYFENGLFIIATQKKSILCFEEVDKTPNWRNIFNGQSGMGIPPHSTNYQKISVLPPAHFLMYQEGELQIKRYWELDTSKRITFKHESDYVDRFRELFSLAIKDRMDATGRLGTHLSGGLDSSGISGIVHSLSKNQEQEALYFSYGFEKKHFKGQKILLENSLAFDFIDYHDIGDNFINVHKHVQRSYAEMVEEECLFCDGFSKSNNVNTEYEIQHAAKEHGANVILSGFPGDELVSSFCRPYYLEYFERRQWIKYFTKKMRSRHEKKEKIRAFGGAVFSSINKSLTNKIAAYYYNKKGANKGYFGSNNYFNRDYFDKFDKEGSLNEIVTFPMVHFGFPTSLREYQKNHICRPHTSRRIASENLTGLNFGLEYRYPMTDIRVLQFLLAIPMEQKIAPTMTRKIFRLGTKGYIPDSIRLREDKSSGSLKPMLHFYNRKFGRSPLDLWEKYEKAECAPFLKAKAVRKYFNNKENDPRGLMRFMILAQLGYDKKMQF